MPLSSPSVLHALPIILLDFITRTILGKEYRSAFITVCSASGQAHFHSPALQQLQQHIIFTSTFGLDRCTEHFP
jgi:hypothetical protein